MGVTLLFLLSLLSSAACTAVGRGARVGSVSRSAPPLASAPAASPRLVGYENFVRTNPLSDRFGVRAFHHIEFLCGDAANTAARWCAALGCETVATSSLLTGNSHHASHVIRSGELVLAFTAPYADDATQSADSPTILGADGRREAAAMRKYFERHGLSAFAVALLVDDAREAFESAVAGGAKPIMSPRSRLAGDSKGDAHESSEVVVSEVQLYGDVALRFVSGTAIDQGELSFLPGYVAAVDAGAKQTETKTFGIISLDHCVGNVPDLLETVEYLHRATGFHEFAEFTAKDVGTVDSGLNSMVLACNSEKVLLPLNEPTTGGRRKSQIQTYLDQHNGPGVQHLALKTNDIFSTVRAMRDARGGFALMDRPREEYYDALRSRLGEDALSAAQVEECRELGILADRDDQGVLLQIFTKPVADRSTLFLEVIQRIGCEVELPAQPEDISGAGAPGGLPQKRVEQTPGCGGFGKGNFHELFRAIEEYETKAGINKI